MTRLPVRLLLFSSSIPPKQSGVAVVLGRLFGGVHPDDYRIATFETDELVTTDGPGLAARTYRLDSAWQVPGASHYFLAPVRALRQFGTEIVRRSRLVAEVIAGERCDAVMVTSGGNPNVAAAYLAARMTRRPLLIYMFDDWRYQLVNPAIRVATGVLQPLALDGSAGVLVPCEPLKEGLERAYRCSCTVIRNPVAEADLVAPPAFEAPWPGHGDATRIVYTGQVYAAQLDSLQRVANALTSPRLRGVTLHLYTAQKAEDLRGRGLDAHVEVHPYLPPDEVRRVQRAADILLLPLAFASPYPRIIRTAAPAKLGEYLASGRPILVHAPPRSFVSDFGRQNRLAEVVDEPAPELIADAIERIAADATYRRELGSRARAVAEREFSISASRERLVRFLERSLPRVAA